MTVFVGGGTVLLKDIIDEVWKRYHSTYYVLERSESKCKRLYQTIYGRKGRILKGGRMTKQNPYRFSLGFDEEDPEHQEVAKILNQLGHRKAKFVVKAVLAYHKNIEGKYSKESAVIDKKLDTPKKNRVIQLQEEFLPTLQEEDILMIQKNKELLQEMEKEELEENKSSYKEEL